MDQKFGILYSMALGTLRLLLLLKDVLEVFYEIDRHKDYLRWWLGKRNVPNERVSPIFTCFFTSGEASH